MDAEDAASIAPVGTDFLSEAGRDAGVALGQLRLLDPFVTMESGDGLLRRGNQVFFINLLVFSFLASFTNHLTSL